MPNYDVQDDAKPQRRQSYTPAPPPAVHTRPSSSYASTPRTTPSPPSSLDNLMTSQLFPTLLKQSPDRPLIINLGTLNLTDPSTTSDDASLTTATTATSSSERYGYRDLGRPSSYYYRPSSFSASFSPKERAETYVHYTRPSKSESVRGGHSWRPTSLGDGGLYIASATPRGTSSRGSSASYYREPSARDVSTRYSRSREDEASPRDGPARYSRGREDEATPRDYPVRYSRHREERLVEMAYCGGCCKFEELDGTGLCDECAFFVPKTAARYSSGQRPSRDHSESVGSMRGGVARSGAGRGGFGGVRYVDSGKGDGDWWARKRAEGRGGRGEKERSRNGSTRAYSRDNERV